MSILIKGMEMPKHGDVLVVREYNGKTYIKHEGHLGFEATLSKIPTPHGRLIDADALKNDMRDWNPSIIAVVDAMSTVIESEGSEK